MQNATCSVGRKTLIKPAAVEETVNAHNFQANQRHRLQRGDRRLAVWKGRSPENYCQTCAKEIIEQDIARLTKPAKQLDGAERIQAVEASR